MKSFLAAHAGAREWQAAANDCLAQLGPIPFEDLVGRAFVVFWPRANWQWL